MWYDVLVVIFGFVVVVFSELVCDCWECVNDVLVDEDFWFGVDLWFDSICFMFVNVDLVIVWIELLMIDVFFVVEIE